MHSHGDMKKGYDSVRPRPGLYIWWERAPDQVFAFEFEFARQDNKFKKHFLVHPLDLMRRVLHPNLNSDGEGPDQSQRRWAAAGLAGQVLEQ